MNEFNFNLIKILLVEDNPLDVELTKESLKETKIKLNLDVVSDGIQAMEYLENKNKSDRKNFPDLIFLDLNMPKKNGLEVLQELKENENYKHIPVIILTSSESDEDILRSYKLQASSFITKPVDLTQFTKIVRSIENFWFTVVKLPRKI